MKNATTTEIIFRTNASYVSYFVAHLDNGGVRVGMVGFNCFDFPSTHPDYERCVNLTPETVEDAYDEFFGKYCCN